MPASAVRQKVRPPKQKEIIETDIKSHTQSVLFMKRFIAVGVSSLCYYRDALPETSFETRKFGKLSNLKIINGKANGDQRECKNALASCLHGAFDALEKGYLRAMIITFHEDEDNSDHVLESYRFDMKKTADGGYEMEVNPTNSENATPRSTRKKKQQFSKDAITCMTQNLLMQIFSMTENLHRLPTQSFIGVKLLYNDEITPKDYEPPGFAPAKAGFQYVTPKGEEYSDCQKLDCQLGSVKTNFHDVKVHAVSMLMKTSEDVVAANVVASSNDTDLEVPDSGLHSSPEIAASQTPRMPNHNNNVSAGSQMEVSDADDGGSQEVPNGQSQSHVSVESQHSIYEGETVLRCVCACTETDIPTLVCSVCSTAQHAICYGFPPDCCNLPPRHVCINCHSKTNPNKSCTDDSFVGLQDVKCQLRALQRKIFWLLFTSRVTEVVPEMISHVFDTLKVHRPIVLATKFLNKTATDRHNCVSESVNEATGQKTYVINQNLFVRRIYELFPVLKHSGAQVRSGMTPLERKTAGLSLRAAEEASDDDVTVISYASTSTNQLSAGKRKTVYADSQAEPEPIRKRTALAPLSTSRLQKASRSNVAKGCGKK